MKSQNIITGTIKQGDLEVNFVGEDYRFIFIPSQYSPQPILLNNKVGVLEPESSPFVVEPVSSPEVLPESPVFVEEPDVAADAITESKITGLVQLSPS